MIEFIEVNKDLSLSNLAYTLQMGREAMESRMALVVNDRETLLQNLKEYVQGSKDGKGIETSIPLYTGDMDDDNSGVQHLLSGKTGDAMLQILLAEKDLEKIALYWAKGAEIPWQLFQKEDKRRIIPLPTYPFAKDKYWVPASVSGTTLMPEQEYVQNHSENVDIIVDGPQQSSDTNIKNCITSILSKALNMPVDIIKPGKNFIDLGVDSIIGQKLMHYFAETFKIKISGREMLEYTTVEALAKHITVKLDRNVKIDNNSETKPAVVEMVQEVPIITALSEGQKGLWLLQKFTPQMGAYNIPMAFRIKQVFNTVLFRKACELMLIRYPVLRTVILEKSGEPYQTFQSETNLSFQTENIEHFKDHEVIPYIKRKSKEPFDLENGPLIRVHLFFRKEQETLVLITIHHIIIDGTSAVLFMKSLWNAYYEYTQGVVPELALSKTSYNDFVKWEQEMVSTEEGLEHLAYWKQQLSGDIPLLSLPTDFSRPVVRSFNGDTYEAILKPELSKKMKEFAKSQQVNLSVLFLGVFKVLLHRYTGQNDIAVGMPTLGRPEQRFEETVGYFINMIVIRSQLTGEQTFSDLLKDLRLTVVDGLDHAAYPFPTLVKNLEFNRNNTAAPLVQVTFAYQNFVQPTGLAELENTPQGFPQIEILNTVHQEGEDDLGLEIFEEKDHFIFKMDYNTDLFESSTIERMMNHYLKLCEEIVKKPNITISRYDFLSPEEKEKILVEWNKTEVDHPKDKCFHELFEAQALKRPNAVALVFEDKQMTYKKLDKKSTQLAKYLQKLGVKPDTLVAICVEPSLNMIVGLLGILKAGGTYVPFGPEYPDKRLKYMLEDSNVSILLTEEKLSVKITNIVDNKTKIVYLDKDWKNIKNCVKVGNIQSQRIRSENIAYVIYTSGSTGRPKGVLISHASIVNHCLAVQNYYGLNTDDRILQFASLNVDASLEQILPGLISGATLILKGENLLTPKEFHKKLRDNYVSVIDIPPAYLRELLVVWDNISITGLQKHLRLVITGGEALLPNTVDLWRNSPMNSIRLINAYGPTETTITSTVFEITAETTVSTLSQNIPIGRPLDNETVYILDRYGNPVPEGIPGELHIGGTGVAIGYLKQPELTEEKFIDNPFHPGSRMYKTGDLVRWLADGNIDFLGRIDYQVKVRGFRIECGEIESILNEQEGIQNSLVIPKTINDSTQLVAYVVPSNKGDLVDVNRLKIALQSKLPEYMVPSVFVSLDEFPITHSGKTDRNALMHRDIELTDIRKYTAPETETEKKLAVIWKEILGLERIGVNDNFFDLGGHSLLSLRLIAEINEKFERNISISTLIQNPGFKELANILDQQLKNEFATPLVCFQPEGNQAPFFCVHAIVGNVLSYRELANLVGTRRPFYGLQSPGLDGGHQPDDIEGMASFYIEAIRKVQSHGPYYIGGWSMGGVIAYEMARQLQLAGDKVAQVVLIDSYTPTEVMSLEKSYNNKNNTGKHDQETLLFGSFALNLGIYDMKEFVWKPGEQLEQILHKAKGVNLLSSDLKTEQILQLFNIFKTNTLAMNKYRPKPYNGPAVLFCANGQSPSSRGWTELIQGELETFMLPGDHYTVLQKPNVEVLADELQRCLK